MDTMTPNGLSDHDLLIELRTEMRAVRTDLKEMKDNSAKRIDALEVEKMNKDEVYRMKTEADKSHEDFEKRLRDIKQEQDNFRGKYAVIATLVMIVISAVVSLIVSMLK